MSEEISQNASTMEKIIRGILGLVADREYDSEDEPGYWGNDTFISESEIIPKAQAILSEYSLRVSKEASLRELEKINDEADRLYGKGSLVSEFIVDYRRRRELERPTKI